MIVIPEHFRDVNKNYFVDWFLRIIVVATYPTYPITRKEMHLVDEWYITLSFDLRRQDKTEEHIRKLADMLKEAKILKNHMKPMIGGEIV